MTVVFVGGSRGITRLNGAVCARLDTIVAKGLNVIVGDANGADQAVQKYLSEKAYGNVAIFCSGDTPRNNVGRWATRKIRTNAPPGTAAFYTAKDEAMTEEATIGFMLWDGKSIGTLLNVQRLIEHGKKVVIFVNETKNFSELKTKQDWNKFYSYCTSEIRTKLVGRAELRKSKAISLSPRIPSLAV